MSLNAEADVVVVGGGPVGLYLAGVLGSNGLNVIILEASTRIDPHSKSLGIHPVSLELFEEQQIAGEFLIKGIKIQTGRAYTDQKWIGSVDFSDCKKPFNYILALPQNRTEETLEKWVQSIESVTMIRGALASEISQSEHEVEIAYRKSGRDRLIKAKYAAGCDGKNSMIREQAGINFKGKSYPDTYVMGDYPDTTGFGTVAAVYLHRAGLVESFPLPDKMRRWVAKTSFYVEENREAVLENLIYERTGFDLTNEPCRMISSFGVQHYLAERFHAGRILLAGDSAHIVSPIGGQGMNLGWITAKNASETILNCLDQPEKQNEFLTNYSDNAIKTAKKVALRAEINMWLGRKRTYPFGRNLLARLIVNTPLQKIMAKMFTMRGL